MIFFNNFVSVSTVPSNAKMKSVNFFVLTNLKIQEATKQILDSYAKEGQQHWNDRLRKGDAFETLEDVTKKIVDTLKEKPKAPEENQAQSVPKGEKKNMNIFKAFAYSSYLCY